MEKTNASLPQLQMFVCTRTKPDGASCGPKGASELRDSLKKWVKEQGMHKKVKVTASLCLGHCENGITVVVHPDNEWFIKVNAHDDIEALKNLILNKVKNLPEKPSE
ncbi:MAG: (2Fe-2S) ferredoxin domain-containing protein [Bdellovibrionaceae bacterium]|nr:(2Fe-2S) ferredoxin domain-containing protein [Pseudobdellovibrionaceae bacterium]